MWQSLISLKSEVTAGQDEQITKQFEEGIYIVAQTAMGDGIVINSP